MFTPSTLDICWTRWTPAMARYSNQQPDSMAIRGIVPRKRSRKIIGSLTCRESHQSIAPLTLVLRLHAGRRFSRSHGRGLSQDDAPSPNERTRSGAIWFRTSGLPRNSVLRRLRTLAWELEGSLDKGNSIICTTLPEPARRLQLTCWHWDHNKLGELISAAPRLSA